MRIYIIASDGITLTREVPATVNVGEIAVASKEDLHAAPLSGKRLLALWNALPGVEKRRKVGDRDALIDQLWSAIEALPDPEPQSDAKRPSKQDEVIAMLRRPEGAAVEEVASVTGWQHHTVRGVFSGTLKKKLGLTLAPPRRNAVASTASPNPRAHDPANPRHFGSPALWRAVARFRSPRRVVGRPTVRCRRSRGRWRDCRVSRSVYARAASCVAPTASHWTASWPQPRSAHPSPCKPAARANPGREEPGAAPPPADPGPGL
jgi:Protein of unknown function (DUF3489)